MPRKTHAVSPNYWLSVRRTAAVEGKTVAEVRRDVGFRDRWNRLRQIWQYEADLWEITKLHSEGRMVAGHRVLMSDELYAESLQALRRRRLTGDTRPLFERVTHNAGGYYAQLLEQLHLRPRGIPQAVGDTPKAERRR